MTPVEIENKREARRARFAIELARGRRRAALRKAKDAFLAKLAESRAAAVGLK